MALIRDMVGQPSRGRPQLVRSSLVAVSLLLAITGITPVVACDDQACVAPCTLTSDCDTYGYSLAVTIPYNNNPNFPNFTLLAKFAGGPESPFTVNIPNGLCAASPGGACFFSCQFDPTFGTNSCLFSGVYYQMGDPLSPLAFNLVCANTFDFCDVTASVSVLTLT